MDHALSLAAHAGESAVIITDEWPDRCAHWRAEIDRARPMRSRRQREPSPLIITGEGASISVDKGALLVREGLTHYPQEKAAHRFFKGDLARPRAIVLVDGSGAITFDALDWMSDQDIALIRLDWTGAVRVVMSPSGFAADPERVAWQRETYADREKRLAFSCDLIRQKLEASLVTMRDRVPASRSCDAAIALTTEKIGEIAQGAIGDLAELRGLEGHAANAYFQSWGKLEVRWNATARFPIPYEWRRFKSRTSLTNAKPHNRNASHPINAMLNYAYGMLQARLQIRTIADGHDPTIGIMHERYRNMPAFVFDLMEPQRPVVDAAILAFAADNVFSAADFTIRNDGACRLNPVLARRVVQVVDDDVMRIITQTGR